MRHAKSLTKIKKRPWFMCCTLWLWNQKLKSSFLLNFAKCRRLKTAGYWWCDKKRLIASSLVLFGGSLKTVEFTGVLSSLRPIYCIGESRRWQDWTLSLSFLSIYCCKKKCCEGAVSYHYCIAALYILFPLKWSSYQDLSWQSFLSV